MDWEIAWTEPAVADLEQIVRAAPSHTSQPDAARTPNQPLVRFVASEKICNACRKEGEDVTHCSASGLLTLIICICLAPGCFTCCRGGGSETKVIVVVGKETAEKMAKDDDCC